MPPIVAATEIERPICEMQRGLKFPGGAGCQGGGSIIDREVIGRSRRLHWPGNSSSIRLSPPPLEHISGSSLRAIQCKVHAHRNIRPRACPGVNYSIVKIGSLRIVRSTRAELNFQVCSTDGRIGRRGCTGQRRGGCKRWCKCIGWRPGRCERGCKGYGRGARLGIACCDCKRSSSGRRRCPSKGGRWGIGRGRCKRSSICRRKCKCWCRSSTRRHCKCRCECCSIRRRWRAGKRWRRCARRSIRRGRCVG